jgi:hypothetical protein
LGFFELAGVDAEVAVGGFEHTLEVVEAEGIVGRKGADDAEADAFVNQAIEFRKFVGTRVNLLMRLSGVLLAKLAPRLFSNLRLVFGMLPVR